MKFCTQIFHNRGHKMCLYAKSLGRGKKSRLWCRCCFGINGADIFAPKGNPSLIRRNGNHPPPDSKAVSSPLGKGTAEMHRQKQLLNQSNKKFTINIAYKGNFKRPPAPLKNPTQGRLFSGHCVRAVMGSAFD